MIVTVNGVAYHVCSDGAGSPIVLLHGFTGSVCSWTPLLADFVSTHQVIRIDLLGHGQTDCPETAKRYSMEHQVADLVAIFDALHVKKTDLLGYSMGGRTALSLACLHPERIRTLVLESASPGLESEEEREARRAHDQKLAQFISDKGVEAFARFWETIPLFASQKNLPEFVCERLRHERLMNHAEGLAGSLRGMGTGAQPSWWKALPELDLPVLLITGSKDEKFCSLARRMRQILKNAEWSVVKGSGHIVHLENHSRFAEIVLQFLKGRVAHED